MNNACIVLSQILELQRMSCFDIHVFAYYSLILFIFHVWFFGLISHWKSKMKFLEDCSFSEPARVINIISDPGEQYLHSSFLDTCYLSLKGCHVFT